MEVARNYLASAKRRLEKFVIANQKSCYQLLGIYVGHLESKERLRIQPAQLFNFS